MDKISKFNGELEIIKDIIKAELTDNKVFEIYGDKGHGKTHFINELKKELKSKESIVLNLCLNPILSEKEYGVFLNTIYKHLQYENDLNFDLIKFLKPAALDIPYFGNSVSAILEAFENRHIDKQIIFSDTEKIILELIKKISKEKKIYILCDDFDKWSKREQNFLLNIINNHVIDFSKLILTKSNSSESFEFGYGKSDMQLKTIEKNDFLSAIQEFNTSINLTSEQIDLIFNIANGNLHLIKKLLILKYRDNALKNEDKNLIFNLILENLATTPKIIEEKMSEYLKKTSIIGETIKPKLHKMITEDLDVNYSFYLNELKEKEILKPEKNLISFNNSTLKDLILETVTKGDSEFYIKLVECIKILYPTDYKNQFINLLKTYDQENAIITYLQYATQQFRNKNYEIIDLSLLSGSENSVYLEYLEFVKANYELYQLGEFQQVRKNISDYSIQSGILEYEINYLETLCIIQTDMDILKLKRKITYFQNMLTDDIKNKYPEIYIRANALLLDLYYHTDNLDEIKDVHKQLCQCIAKFSDTDELIAKQQNILYSKAILMFNIEIAVEDSKKALNYFKKFNNNYLDIHNYYYTLLNHSAYSLLMSNYDKCIECFNEAELLISSFNDIRFERTENLLNNYLVAKYLSEPETINDTINSFEQLLLLDNQFIDRKLIENNLVALFSIDGQDDKAFELSFKLYDYAKTKRNFDSYYKYYIYNNYAVLCYKLNKKDEAIKVFTEICDLTPHPYETDIFKLRETLIKELFLNNQLIENTDFNNYLFSKDEMGTNDTWKFLGTMYLFSDLQVWSNFTI